MEPQLLTLLDGWRNSPLEMHGYGPGNVVNLVRVLRGDLRSLNLARLGVRQAYLAGVEAQDASLAGAHLIEAVLAESFIYPIRLALSANGALLLAGTSSGQVWLWRVSDSTPLLAVQAHHGPVHGVAISADGQLLASAGEDGAIRVWSFDPASTPVSPFGPDAATSGQLVASLHGHDSAVLSTAMSPAGDLLLSGGLDGRVRVWDPLAGQVLATLLVWLVLDRQELAQADLRTARRGFQIAGQQEIAQQVERLLRQVEQRRRAGSAETAPAPLIKRAYVSAAFL